MTEDFLQLNESKSEVIVFGFPDLAKQAIKHPGPQSVNLNNHVRNLAVIGNSDFKFDKQINAEVKNTFFNSGPLLT